MIAFRVDSIGFYANKVDGHKGRFDTSIYIWGMLDKDRNKIMGAYLDKWHPAGYGTTADYVVKKDESYILLTRRNSCD